MGLNIDKIDSIYATEANEIAQNFKSSILLSKNISGINTELIDKYSWNSWKPVGDISSAYLYSYQGYPILIFWFEEDDFNSFWTHVSQARVHWQISSDFFKLTPNDFHSTLVNFFESLKWEMLSLRMYGDIRGVNCFWQSIGFNFIHSNVWFYNEKHTLPFFKSPSKVIVDWYNLEEKLPTEKIVELTTIANNSFFFDRFYKDIRIPKKHSHTRFLKVAENVFLGKLVKYLLTASYDQNMKAVIFFDIDKNDQIKVPLAGRWFTAMALPNTFAQGLCYYLFAHAMRDLPEGRADWFYSCALDNFKSLQAHRKLKFRLGAISHDFHRWKHN